MAYQLQVIGTIAWVGDGTGQMSVPSAQSMRQTVAFATVPGNDAPTSGNITTACNTAATALAAIFNTTTNLGIIQGWATGNP